MTIVRKGEDKWQSSRTVKKTAEYTKRFDERYDELKWLYCELYNNNMEAFDWLCDSLYGYYQERNADLKKLDRSRVKNPDWYKQNDLLGMMMYTNAFAGTLKGVKEKLPYVKSCGVNYLHFMPLLESPKGRDDGGYAVADFRKVKPELGTMGGSGGPHCRVSQTGYKLLSGFRNEPYK